MPIERNTQVAKLIAEDFYLVRLDLSDRDVTPDFDAWENMPEVECVERLRRDGVGQPEIRLFLTFIGAMDRARDATRLWNQGVELFTCHPELFRPQHVSQLPIGDLKGVLAEFGVSQHHRPDSSAWAVIARSLVNRNDPVTRAVYDGKGDAQEILNCLQSKNHGKANFPHLRGAKIGPVWIRMLVAPGDAKIENMHVIPVAVDVHVARVTKNLIPTVAKDRESVQRAWHQAVLNAEISGPEGLSNTSAALDPALWTFGKYGCSYCENQGRAFPISAACEQCALNTSQRPTILPSNPKIDDNALPNLQERLNLAITAATQAGHHTLRYFRASDLAIETKPDHSPVTHADKESEQILRAYLAQRFPQDTIVGEEFGTQHGTTDYKWYLDPIDGTKSFIRGIPLFGVMMGLEHRDEAVAGVIVFPALNEIVYAAKGLGAWWSDSIDPIVPKQARVTKVSNLSDACLSTTSTRSFHRIGKSTQFQRLSWVVDVNRGLPDCYGHYLVATGRAEIMIDPIMNAWDNAPLQAIIEEAGGRFTDLQNNPTIHGDSAISTNGLLHDQVLEILNNHT